MTMLVLGERPSSSLATYSFKKRYVIFQCRKSHQSRTRTKDTINWGNRSLEFKNSHRIEHYSIYFSPVTSQSTCKISTLVQLHYYFIVVQVYYGIQAKMSVFLFKVIEEQDFFIKRVTLSIVKSIYDLTTCYNKGQHSAEKHDFFFVKFELKWFFSRLQPGSVGKSFKSYS